MWKRLSVGQKCFLRPYFPLNWEVILDFRFGHWKWPNRERGKGHFHLLKWLCPHSRFQHPKSPCQKHISMIHLLNTEKGVPSEYPGSHITERNIKTGNQCKSGQKIWERRREPPTNFNSCSNGILSNSVSPPLKSMYVFWEIFVCPNLVNSSKQWSGFDYGNEHFDNDNGQTLFIDGILNSDGYHGEIWWKLSVSAMVYIHLITALH